MKSGLRHLYAQLAFFKNADPRYIAPGSSGSVYGQPYRVASGGDADAVDHDDAGRRYLAQLNPFLNQFTTVDEISAKRTATGMWAPLTAFRSWRFAVLTERNFSSPSALFNQGKRRMWLREFYFLWKLPRITREHSLKKIPRGFVWSLL